MGIPGLVRRRSGASDTQGRAMAAALSKLFSWLIEHRQIDANPCVGMYKPKTPQARDRVLTPAEIRWLWQACEGAGEPFAALIRLLLITGGRLNEAAGMTVSELSEDGKVWNLPGERSKNRRPHVVYLPPLARTLLADLPRVEGGFVFTTRGKSPVWLGSKVKARLDAAMLVAARQEAREAASLPTWRVHDLRRTAATGMAELGIAPHIIEAVLNHVSGARAGVAGVYNRAAYSDEKRVALERWAAHLEGLVSGRAFNVVSLAQAGRQ